MLRTLLGLLLQDINFTSFLVTKDPGDFEVADTLGLLKGEPGLGEDGDCFCQGLELHSSLMGL